MNSKYRKAKHHAWAGLGFLSVLLASTYFVELPRRVFLPFLLVLIIYITTGLVLTYRYAADPGPEAPKHGESGKAKKKKAKARAKTEKKKAKAEAKKRKKK